MVAQEGGQEVRVRGRLRRQRQTVQLSRASLLGASSVTPWALSRIPETSSSDCSHALSAERFALWAVHTTSRHWEKARATKTNKRAHINSMMADGRSWDDMDQIKRGWDMSFSYIYMVSRGRSGIPLVQDQQRLRLTGVLTSGRVARTGRVIHFGLISFRRSTVQYRWKAEQMWTTSRANPRTLAIWRPNLASRPHPRSLGTIENGPTSPSDFLFGTSRAEH
jgi:hypothetical protein